MTKQAQCLEPGPGMSGKDGLLLEKGEERDVVA